MIFETYDDIEPVRPYLWMGEDQDAHVREWENAEKLNAVAAMTGTQLAAYLAFTRHEANLNSQGLPQIARIQNSHSFRQQVISPAIGSLGGVFGRW